jgi:nucleoside 2-deoxyribosyltransferase
MARDKAIISEEDLLAVYPKEPLDYLDRALENLARLAAHPVGTTVIAAWDIRALFSRPNRFEKMLEALEGEGFIKYSPGGTAGPSFEIKPAGWRRLRELRQVSRNSTQAFVAMCFADSQKVYFEEGIRPAIEADGKFTALRIDRKDHNNRIDDEIIAEIRRSRFVVADFSEHRNGVYFEAGLALGIGLPVIWSVHADHLAAAHFDTRQFNHIVYCTPAELRDALRNRIRATVI